ncbi:MAG: HAD family hydrolase [Nitrospirota bacterium]
MRLVLFDIDGTLIDSGGAGVRALELALKELFSVENGFHGISMAGKTDPSIMREGLKKHGLSENGNLELVIEAYLAHLSREIENSRRKIKPGIYDVLERLMTIADVGIGLLTGNLERGARIKLEPFNLNSYFPTGAFGSDDEDRNKLLPVAVARFEDLTGEKIRIEESVIVGDTPRDVECAKICGAKCVGVATGPYPFKALVDAGADYVFQDLTDHTMFLDLL